MSVGGDAWLDGAVVAADAAVLPATDLGLRQGLGVFETLRVSNGRTAGFEHHLARLVAGGVRLGIPVDPTSVRAGVAALVERAATPEVVVRITVTAGDAEMAWPPSPAGRPRTLITLHPAPPLPTPPADAVVVPGPRAPAGLADVKTTSYAGSIVAARAARARGAEVALLEDGDEVREAADGNLLVLRGGTLTTPPADGRIVPGVTRRIVLDLAPRLGLAVAEAPVTRVDLRVADLVLVSSAVRRLRPVRRIDGEAIADGSGGADHPVLAALRAGLADATAAAPPLAPPPTA